MESTVDGPYKVEIGELGWLVDHDTWVPQNDSSYPVVDLSPAPAVNSSGQPAIQSRYGRDLGVIAAEPWQQELYGSAEWPAGWEHCRRFR